MLRKLAIVILIAIVAFTLIIISSASSEEPKSPRATEPTEQQTALIPPEVEAITAVALQSQAVGSYIVTEAIGDYVAARAAAEQAAAAEAAHQALPTATSTPSYSGVTGQCGGATNGADQFIGGESGGNPGVYNAGGSGAWGCYQIMPGTWAASCGPDNNLGLPPVSGGYGSASAAAQAECASRLPMSAWGGG